MPNHKGLITIALEKWYSHSALNKLPKLYRRFFPECCKILGTTGGRLLTTSRTAQGSCTGPTTGTKLSTNLKGYIALELAGFSEQEQSHICGLSNESMDNFGFNDMAKAL